MARTWNLRFNLDVFNAAFASLDDAEERSEFLVGLSRGVNSGRVKDDCSDAMATGFAIGSDMRSEADEFTQKMVKGGRNSAQSRKDRDGTAQPKSNKIEGGSEPASEGSSNQSTIHNPQSFNDKPEKKSSASQKPRRPAGKNGYRPPVEVPAPLVPVAEWLFRDWPKVSYDPKGERLIDRLSPKGIWTRLLEVSEKCGVEPGPLLFAGVAYLDRVLEAAKDTGKPSFVKNMKNFWGLDPENRKWDEFYEDAKLTYNKHMEEKGGHV